MNKLHSKFNDAFCVIILYPGRPHPPHNETRMQITKLTYPLMCIRASSPHLTMSYPTKQVLANLAKAELYSEIFWVGNYWDPFLWVLLYSFLLFEMMRYVRYFTEIWQEWNTHGSRYPQKKGFKETARDKPTSSNDSFEGKQRGDWIWGGRMTRRDKKLSGKHLN